MKKLTIILILCFVTIGQAADTKLTGLTELTTPTTTDILYIVDDPGGTPLSRKITRDNLIANWVGSSNITTLGTLTTGVWSATDVSLAAGGTGASLSDPGADRIFFWDDGATATAWLIANIGLSITGVNLNWTYPDGDVGDFTYTSGSATLDNDVIAAAEMADADHGDVAWSSGVASVQAVGNDAVALTTDTTGSYVASITNGAGISGGDGGSEGAALTLAATLGTAIDTSEITDDTIEIADVNMLNTPADEDIITYETGSGGGFEGMTIVELLATTDTDSLSEGSTNLYANTEEEIEDFVGGMLGGTETDIAVTYQDATNDIDFVVTSLVDIVTTSPLTVNTGANLDDVIVGSDADVTLALTLLKDLVTTAPITGGTNDIFPGADADITIAIAADGIDSVHYNADSIDNEHVNWADIDNLGDEGAVTLAATLTITDNESTAENNALIFTSGGDLDGGDLGLECDGTTFYTPSTGKITATGFVGALTGNADTATLAATVTYADNESTAENNAVVFLPGGDLDGGNLAPEVDGDFHYNPSTGTVTTTEFVGGGAGVASVDAITGDSATAFFDAGTIEHEYGGLEADISSYTGLIAITGGATAEVDAKSELEGHIADVADFAEADGDTYTGTHDFGGASIEIDNDESADAALGALGTIHIRGDEDRVSYHVGTGGEVAGEVTVSILSMVSVSFDPGAWYDSDAEVFLFEVHADKYPNGIILDEWKVSCNIDPDVEMDANIGYADSWFDAADPNLVDVINTSAGVSTEDTDANINSGNAVAAGKCLFLYFDADPEGTAVQMNFTLIFHAEED